MWWLASASVALGVVPLVAMQGVHFAGGWRPRVWWALAVAFAVSFVADVAAWAWSPALVSQVYLVSQAGLFLLALAPRYASVGFAAVLAAAGWSLASRRGEGLDVALHVTAYAVVAVAAWASAVPRALRLTLATGFAALAVAWVGYVASPGWWTWGAYHGVRAAMAAAFVVAVLREKDNR